MLTLYPVLVIGTAPSLPSCKAGSHMRLPETFIPEQNLTLKSIKQTYQLLHTQVLILETVYDDACLVCR